MSDPRPYNIDDPAELDRLHSELLGYMRVSLHDGTDTEGRAHAYAALCELDRRRHQHKQLVAILAGAAVAGIKTTEGT